MEKEGYQMKVKLTKNDIEQVIPPKKKNEAIEQTERYEKEYEISKKELDRILEQMDALFEQLKESDEV